MKNVVKVQLAGRAYTLNSDESADYTIRLARELNRRIDIIMNASPGLSSLDAALLCALDCLDEMTKANSNMENIRNQIKDYVDDAGQARIQADEAGREVRQLRARVGALQAELKKRTTVIRYDNERVENAKDMLSKEINAAINKPMEPSAQQSFFNTNTADPNKR